MDKPEPTIASNRASGKTSAASAPRGNSLSKIDGTMKDAAPCVDYPSDVLSRPERMGLLGEDRKPRVDLVENDDQIVVTAEAPGFNGSKETLAGLGRIRYLFDVTINDDTLTIEGKAESKRLDGCNGDLYREIHSDDFIRTLTLPASVNCGEARASYKNGVFEVTLPKTEKTKRHAVRL